MYSGLMMTKVLSAGFKHEYYISFIQRDLFFFNLKEDSQF